MAEAAVTVFVFTAVFYLVLHYSDWNHLGLSKGLMTLLPCLSVSLKDSEDPFDGSISSEIRHAVKLAKREEEVLARLRVRKKVYPNQRVPMHA